LHKNIADYKNVVESGDGIECPGSARLGAQVGGRWIEILFAVMNGEGEKDGEEWEGNPYGEGN
jgi:hypothetical protein